MSKITSDVLFDAREEVKTLNERIAVAEKVYEDLSGRKQQGGLTLTIYGKYITVDDEADRWLATVDEFQDGLDFVLNNIIEEGVYMDDSTEAYNDLCGECPALYSRIGNGEYNKKTDELLALLRETLNEEQVIELTAYLGID